MEDIVIIASKEVAYSDMVLNLAKNGGAIIEDMNEHDAHIMHMAIGVSGEAGELLDAIKKKVIYGKELDYTNVIEELGDLEFYIDGLRTALGITRQQTLQANANKLAKRYSGGTYSDLDAQTRADKIDEQQPHGM